MQPLGDLRLILFPSKTRVLLVCTENICRSPMAEGLLCHYLRQADLHQQVDVASAGTKASQPGCRADQRAQKVAALHGINISRIKARRITQRDFQRSDFIFAMDESNMRDLLQMCPPECADKISFLLSHQMNQPLLEVPDPYFGSAEGFERVFRILDNAMGDLISYLAERIPRI
ncbi:MAG: low molecular weight protein-tyrosine-phosphatase [Halioglobus sp.]